jgi:transposase, IS5 family
MVDASLTDSPRKHKGKTTYEIAEDRQEDNRGIKQKEKEESNMKMIKIQ